MLNKKQNISIFIINLKKDSKKKEYMNQLCKKYNLEYEFIEAINGELLDEKAILDVYSLEESIKEVRRGLFTSEIGCALSHKYIYEKMLKNNIQEALILEDDIIFDRELIEVLKNKNLFPADWELILLGHHTYKSRDIETNSSIWGEGNLINDYKLKRPSEVGRGTYGYYINIKGAKKLLKELKLICKPIDHYTGDDKYINLYSIVPAVVKVHDYLSNEFHSMEDREKSKLLKVKNRKLLKKLLKKTGLFTCILFLRDNLKKVLPLRKYVNG